MPTARTYPLDLWGGFPQAETKSISVRHVKVRNSTEQATLMYMGKGGEEGGSPTTCKQTPTKFPSPNYSNYMERSGELPSKPKGAVSCHTVTRSWSHSGSSIDTLYTVTMVVTITEVDRSSLRTYSTGAVQRNKGSLRFFLIHTVW